MSDEKITLTKRVVNRNKVDNNYYVMERQADGWTVVSKGYAHSTSAYAKLGRLTQQETLKLLK